MGSFRDTGPAGDGDRGSGLMFRDGATRATRASSRRECVRPARGTSSMSSMSLLDRGIVGRERDAHCRVDGSRAVVGQVVRIVSGLDGWVTILFFQDPDGILVFAFGPPGPSFLLYFHTSLSFPPLFPSPTPLSYGQEVCNGKPNNQPTGSMVKAPNTYYVWKSIRGHA